MLLPPSSGQIPISLYVRFSGVFILILNKKILKHKRLLFDFWGATAKLRKATISFMPACPSVRMKQLDSHWTDFS
jgi:hypothetical protein